jgi:hypothetical protein
LLAATIVEAPFLWFLVFQSVCTLEVVLVLQRRGIMMEGCTIVDDPEIQLTSICIATYNIRNGRVRGFKAALRAMGQMNITQGLPSLPSCM